MQLVQVRFDNGTRAYTYSWKGDDTRYLVKGDRVVVPANWATPEPQLATVAVNGSEYKGPTVDLLGYVDAHTHVVYGPDGQAVV